MNDAALRRLAETLGWIAYLHVVGAGEYRRELLRLDPNTAIEDGPAKVLRLEEYRAKRRRRRAAGRSAGSANGRRKVA